MRSGKYKLACNGLVLEGCRFRSGVFALGRPMLAALAIFAAFLALLLMSNAIWAP